MHPFPGLLLPWESVAEEGFALRGPKPQPANPCPGVREWVVGTTGLKALQGVFIALSGHCMSKGIHDPQIFSPTVLLWKP